MVLVPPDAAVRLRAQVESELRAPLQQLQPLRGIPADLPEMQRGQAFTAQIREALPNNSYRALVAGRLLTLQLPEGAKAGDELELVVLDRSGKVIIARQLEGGNARAGGAAPSPYAFAKFSAAARLIGQLLPADGEAPPPAQLNRGQPLLGQPPAAQNAAALLAPALGKAVAQSGLFYEAHQAQWIDGKLPLARLLQEPQGRHTPSAPPAAPEAARDDARLRPVAVAQQPVPDDLRPLVQQQLEAAATHRMVWHGEIWPRQSLEWQIEWDRERDGDGSNEAEEDTRWRTALSLTMPQLGRIDAALQFSPQGVRIALAASSASGAAALCSGVPALAAALAAAGVPLGGVTVKFADEHPAGQG